MSEAAVGTKRIAMCDALREVWIEITGLDDRERRFVLQGASIERTEPFEAPNTAPWTAEDYAAMHAHLASLRAGSRM